MKNLAILARLAILTLALPFLFVSCEKDEIKEGLTLKFQATQNTTKSSTVEDSFIIESFVINIEEIELEFDDDDPLFETDSIASDIELKGPFEVDLMQNGNALSTNVVQNVALPQAAYDEIEFTFDKNENAISEMFEKSILVKGTLHGMPFVFWTDEEFEIEIEFENDVLLEEAEMAVVTVSFDILALFDSAQGGINILSATDGNENGVIEIYPEDPDGNEELADQLLDRLDDIIDSFEDRYDD